jgi:hypothetical protein
MGPVENARVTRSSDLHLRPALLVTAAAHARRGRSCSGKQHTAVKHDVRSALI